MCRKQEKEGIRAEGRATKANTYSVASEMHPEVQVTETLYWPSKEGPGKFMLAGSLCGPVEVEAHACTWFMRSPQEGLLSDHLHMIAILTLYPHLPVHHPERAA